MGKNRCWGRRLGIGVIILLYIFSSGVYAEEESKVPASVMGQMLSGQSSVVASSVSVVQSTADPIFEITLTSEKKTYCTGEGITVIGQITEDTRQYNASKHNQSANSPGATVDLYLYRGAAGSSSRVLISNHSNVGITETGNFSSSLLSSNNPGKYKIVASFKDYVADTSNWNTSIDVHVSKKCIDRFLIYTDKSIYYNYFDTGIGVYVEAQKFSNGEYVSVSGAEFNWTLRTADEETILYSGTGLQTDSTGKYNTTASVPAAVGKYIVEVNDFASKSTFFVHPYEVEIAMKDSTGSSTRATYDSTQTARVEVAVTINNTVPTGGTFTFSGDVRGKDGQAVQTIPSTNISSPTYTGTYDFLLENFSIGSYMTNVTVTDGTNPVTVATFFDVRNWELGIEIPADSGFLFGSTGFAGDNVRLVMKANSLATGEPITGLESSTTIQIFNKQGVVIGDINTSDTAEFEYSNSSGGYLIKLTMPGDVGLYTLRVTSSDNTGDTMTAEKILKVTDTVAYASTVDRKGEIKEIFGGSEKIYVSITAKNSAGPVTVNNATLVEVRDEEGNPVTFTYMNWSNWSNASLNDNTTGNDWSRNYSYQQLVVIGLDNPRKGGLYFVTVLVNDESRANARFTIDPYKACAFPKSATESYYRWQFSVTDPVRFEVTVTENRPKAGKSMLFFSDYICGGFGGGGGSNTVSGATVSVLKIMNEQAKKEISLDDINITQGITDSNGQAFVTLTPKGNWTGGWYQVIFKITGPDNVTTGRGYGGFEARRFYIWGFGIDENTSTSDYWQYKWNFRPGENVSIGIEMYDAEGGTWWKTGSGLNGQATADKILYHGTPGNWIWPPIEYSYQGTLPSTSIKNGKGNFTLTAPASKWKTGEYSIVIKGSNENGEEDYGWAWFSVRLWDAWGRAVDNETFEDKWDGFSTEEGVGMLVEIHNAGNWWWDWGKSQALEEAPVKIGIEKIQDYASWPPTTMSESNYTSTTIEVNESTDLYQLWWSPNKTYLKDYTVMLNPTDRWSTGFYNVVLNLTGANGTHETGWGWFNIRAFYTWTDFVDENGTSIWRSRGGNDTYFNITTTKDYWNPWSGTSVANASPVNTTVDEIILWMWKEDSWCTTELRYPGDLEVTPIEINGSTTIKINRTDGNPWEAGWYWGDIITKDIEDNTDRGYLWFEIKPFDVYINTLDSSLSYAYEVSPSSNLSLNITVKDPEDWSWPGTPLPGNYSITKIVDETWGHDYSQTELESSDYNPANFSGGSQLVNVSPPGGSWDGGYHNLRVVIRDDSTDSTGETGTGWAWFNVVPFKVKVLSIKGESSNTWSTTLRPSETSFNITFRAYDPITNESVNKTLERVGTWDTSYTFITTDGDSIVNGTENVTVSSPDGWEQGWYWLDFEFEENVRTGISLDVRSFVGWASAPSTAPEGNVTIGYQAYDSWTYDNPVNVNISKVEIKKDKDYSYTDYTSNATYTNGTSSGQVNVSAPPGKWEKGWYSGILHLVDETGDTSKFYFWFEVTSPEIYIYYPYTGARISGEKWLYANTRNDYDGIIQEVNFILIDSNSTKTLIGSGNQSEWYWEEWFIIWDASSHENGEYTIRVDAYNGSGALIDSDTTGTFNIIKPANATFTGVYKDFVGDADGDGYYDYLYINATLNVTVAGEFYAGSSLYSQNGTWVAWGGTDWPYPHLEKGEHDITLKFRGLEIRRSKTDGPYKLEYLYLYDTSSWNWLDSKNKDAYNTTAYNYTQFQKPPAELTGNFTISYSNCTEFIIATAVTVFEEGDYRVSTYLHDQDYNNYSYGDSLAEGLGEGTHMINITFDSSEVSAGNWTIGSFDLYTDYWTWLEYNWVDYDFEVAYPACPPVVGGGGGG